MARRIQGLAAYRFEALVLFKDVPFDVDITGGFNLPDFKWIDVYRSFRSVEPAAWSLPLNTVPEAPEEEWFVFPALASSEPQSEFADPAASTIALTAKQFETDASNWAAKQGSDGVSGPLADTAGYDFFWRSDALFFLTDKSLDACPSLLANVPTPEPFVTHTADWILGG